MLILKELKNYKQEVYAHVFFQKQEKRRSPNSKRIGKPLPLPKGAPGPNSFRIGKGTKEKIRIFSLVPIQRDCFFSKKMAVFFQKKKGDKIRILSLFGTLEFIIQVSYKEKKVLFFLFSTKTKAKHS